MSGIWLDLRYGARTLLRHKGFAAVALLTLALGIGANTAIFSLVDAVLLKQLPVNNPEQLVALDSFNRRGEQRNFSHPVFAQLRANTAVFTGMTAATDGTSTFDLAGPESNQGAAHAEVQMISGEYFQVLGVNAVLGRMTTIADDQSPGANPVAVLSYAFWKRHFGGDASVIGKSLTLKEQPFVVIGVAPRGFFGEAVGRAPDVWVSLMMEPVLDRGQARLDQPNTGWLRIMARLKSGVSAEQAQAAATLTLEQIKTDQTTLGNASRNIARIEVLPGSQGLPEFRRRFAKPLQILMVVVSLVLLIACANVANLLLARATARQKEVAVRLAIGAGRFRLIRQFLTESLLLAIAGGAIGLLFAWWGSRVLLVLVSANSTPIPIDVQPNVRILGFTFAISLLTALLFGVAPALVVSKQEVNSALKVTARLRGRLPLARPLVVAQVALSLLLLIGAALFVQTLRNLRTMDLGFPAENVVQAYVNPQLSGYKEEQLPNLYRRLLESMNDAPGVRSASLAHSGFRTGSSRTCCIAVEGYTPRPDEDREVQTFSVGPGYFKTMGMQLRVGREFLPEEFKRKPGEFARVAVINETMARNYFGSTNPLGRRFGWGDPAKEAVKYEIEIIGVARDANYGNLRDKTKSLIYFPDPGGPVLIVRAASEPETLLATVRQQIQAVDKGLEISYIRTIPQLVDQALVQERLLAKLLSSFSLLALLLACVGLYGVMSYDVARRTQEIGIRMALGARTLHVLRMVLGEMMWLVAIGLLIGLIAALLSTKFVASLLFGLNGNGPLALMLVSAMLLVVVAFIASYLPARRATKIDPLVALRYE
jgi:predicted permease